MTAELICTHTNMTASRCQCGDPKAHVGYARVRPDEGTRLAQLRAAYDDAKKDFDAAKAAFELVKDGIKAELVGQVQSGTSKILLTAAGTPPLQLAYTEQMRLDTKKMKAEDPLTYVRYCKKSGRWELREVTP